MNSTDITKLCVGFPPHPKTEIVRENIIKNIADSFDDEKQALVLTDGQLTGKTTTLAQFAKHYCAISISYFITPSPWTQDIHNFLRSLCNQISAVLEISLPDEDSTVEELKGLFNTLVFRLATKAKKTRQRFYFVLDGLEYSLEGPQGQRIIDIVPSIITDTSGPYILASCRSDFLIKLTTLNGFHKIHLVKFSFRETAEYFEGTNIDESMLKRIYEKVDGIPGYLKIIKDLIENSPNHIVNIDTLPTKLEELVSKQLLMVYDNSTERLKQALEILSSVVYPINIKTLSGILGASASEIDQELSQCGIIEIDKTKDNYALKNKIFYEIAQNKLSSKIKKSTSNLIKYLENQSNLTPSENDLIGFLYKQTGDYLGIENQLRPDAIVKRVQSEEHLASIHRNLVYIQDLAAQQSGFNSTNSLLKWGSVASLLRLVMLFPIDEDEVDALLAIGQEKEALKRAYAIAETSTRIKLLAKSYVSLKKKGQRIQTDAKEELQKLVDTLRVEKVEKELLMQIAIDLFPLFPDLATKLLEKAVHINERKSIFDIALTAATLRSPIKPTDDIISSIENPDLAYAARAHSSWLSNLPLVKLSEEINRIKSTKAKEYLIRKWCKTNRISEELVDAINLWVDTVLEDYNFSVPLKSLRQVSENLRYVIKERREESIERIEIPRLASLNSPKEELVLFFLNIAECVLEIDNVKAYDYLNKAKNIALNETFDLDTRVSCLAKLWVTTARISSNKDDITSIASHFKNDLTQLLSNTANHLEVVKEVLRTVVKVDACQAIEIAVGLNLRSRRNTALGIVLGNLLLEKGNDDCRELIDLGLSYIESEDHTSIFSDVLRIIKNEDKIISEVNLAYLFDKVSQMLSYAEKAQGFITVAEFGSRAKHQIVKKATSNAISSWNEIDDLRVKIKVGYVLVTRIAVYELALAKELMGKIEQIYELPLSKLASGNLSPALLRTIKLVIRALQLSDFTNHLDSIELIESLIDRIPSREMQQRIFGALAAAAYRCGYNAYGDKIIEEKVINKLSENLSLKETQRSLVYCAPVLFEYDPQKTKDLLLRTTTTFRNYAWHKTCDWILSQSLLGDNIESGSSKIPADYKRLLKSVEALENITFDASIYECIKNIITVTENSRHLKKIDNMQALEIVRRLDAIVRSKLPDKENIQHDGYKIISFALLIMLRTKLVEKWKLSTPGLNKVDLNREWKNIELQAAKISNIADRVYIYTLVAEQMLKCDLVRKDGEVLLDDALEQIKLIPSVIDKSRRLQILASTFEKSGLKSQAKFAIEQAMELANQLDGTQKRDQIAMLVQTAHKIDPDLAAQITTKLDSRFPETFDNEALTSLNVEKLVNNPAKLSDAIETDQFLPAIIEKAAKKLLDGVINRKGTIPHERVVNHWLQTAASMDFPVFEKVAEWAIECARQQKTTVSVFNELIHLPRITYELAMSISPQRRLGVSDLIIDSYPGLASRIHVFNAGERHKAIEWLSKWISLHAHEYVKLCDPYFEPSELIFFKDIPEEHKIIIVTTDKKITGTPDSIIMRFHQEWNFISSRRLPKILLCIVPSILESQFHSRALVTVGAGIDLQESLNGLGIKTGKISVLSEGDAKEVETNYIDHMLNQPNWFMNHNTSPMMIQVQ